MTQFSTHAWFQVEARIPIKGHSYQMRVYRDPESGKEHLALLLGKVRGEENVLLRVHSECLTGDLFGSERCDCGSQLQQSIDLINHEKRGIIIYLRQEGRGIGLVEKLKAYNLQEKGLDTIEANEVLGHPHDSRCFELAVDMLKDLGPSSIKLITNNPDKWQALENAGVVISDRISLRVDLTADNKHYLQTKALRLKHLMELPTAKVRMFSAGMS